MGPVVDLVIDLVDRLLDDEELQQAVGDSLVARPWRRLRRNLAVRVEKGGARVVAELVERDGESLDFLRRGRDEAAEG
jgi:hypothetical protein